MQDYSFLADRNYMKEKTPQITCKDALQRLMDGNHRFASARSVHPNRDAERIEELKDQQAPYAAILTCADSRVAPEVVFDQGLGDLFVVRVAGNIINDQLLGSLEYAAAILKVPIIMVMGHTDCGAVKAVASGEKLEGHITSLAPSILPALEVAANMKGEFIDNAIRESARMTAELLRKAEPILPDLVNQQKLQIVPAVYILETGTVALL